MENLLQMNVIKIFELIGFKTKDDQKIKGYQVDVLAEGKHDLKIGIVCIEKSKLDAKSLIHMWSSQSKEMGLDRVLLVFYDGDIGKDEKELGEKLGVGIWNPKDLQKNLDLAIEKKEGAGDDILEDLGIKFEKKVSKPVEESEEEPVRSRRLSLVSSKKGKKEKVVDTGGKARYSDVLRFRHLHFYQTIGVVVLLMSLGSGGVSYYLDSSNWLYIYIALGVVVLSGFFFLLVLSKLAGLKQKYPGIADDDKYYCEKGM